MATAADVRDIFSLPQPSSSKQITRKPAASAKPNGITRELYSLIGDSAPSLVAQYPYTKLKQKPDLTRGKVKWEWKEFENPARDDGLHLRHWMKHGPKPQDEEEYPFAKYTKTSPEIAYIYSMDEYNRLLEDADWTTEETDYLFAMAKEYDVRFYVIADRYDFPGGKTRNMQVTQLVWLC